MSTDNFDSEGIKPEVHFFIKAGAILLLLSLFIPGMSIRFPLDDEGISYESRPTIYLLLRLPRLFYDLLTSPESEPWLIGRTIGFVLSLITIASCLWQVILVFFRKRIPLLFLSLPIFILCLLDSTIPVSEWAGSEIPKLQIGYYVWVLGYLSTIIALTIGCYDRIRTHLRMPLR